jgi:hypothetical protein
MTGASDTKDILLTLHRENSAQVRYYGEQRQSVTNMAAVVTAVVLGLLAFRHSGQLYGNYGLLLHAFFLVAVGTFGFVTSLRHHERSRLHVQRVHAIRRELSRLFPVDVPQLYAAANAEHIKRFARLSERTARMHYVWQLFHASIVGVGVTLVALIAWRPGF